MHMYAKVPQIEGESRDSNAAAAAAIAAALSVGGTLTPPPLEMSTNPETIDLEGDDS